MVRRRQGATVVLGCLRRIGDYPAKGVPPSCKISEFGLSADTESGWVIAKKLMPTGPAILWGLAPCAIWRVVSFLDRPMLDHYEWR